MHLRLDDHFCSCSVAALENVSSQSPKDTLIAYIRQLKHRSFSSADKRYTDGYRFGYYIHLFFSGPKHEGWATHRDHHYSQHGSVDAFAAFLKDNKLGEVAEAPPRWNHRHASRPKGQGDVVAYIWSPDPDALAAWWSEHNPDKPKAVEQAKVAAPPPVEAAPAEAPRERVRRIKPIHPDLDEEEFV